jgi:signal transduction histidine kinase/DNA-binding response OmpR family regulator/ligand-binding sensor domain-containing protein
MTFRNKFIMIKATLTLIQMLFVCFALASESGQFIYFTDIDGLPRNVTTCLEQDKYGYLWVGTSNGIARYDGNTFSSFDQMKEKIINSLYVDTKNNLWVGTNKGLYAYNRITNFFELKADGYIYNIQEDQYEIYFIANTRILKITEKGLTQPISDVDADHFCVTGEGIWYSRRNEGVRLKSRRSGFREIQEQQLMGKTVWAVREIEGNLFIGCNNGELFVRSAAKGKIRNIPVENHYGYVEIAKVRDEIWMATDGNGIVVLDAGLNYSRRITHDPNRNGSISSNSIYDILPGHNGEIWIASYGAGLTCILPDNSLFRNIISEKGNSNSLIANEGIGVHIKDSVFYFGTNYGMSVWNQRDDLYTNLSMDKLRKELHGVKALGITTDKKNNIWIGTYDGLLGKYDREFKLIKTYHPCGNDPNEMQQITHLNNFNESNLLIGTIYNDRCFLNFDMEKETVSPFELFYKGSKITVYQFSSFREKRQGELVALISGEGLFSVNMKDNVLENKWPEMNKKLKYYWLIDFYQDKEGFYWLTSGEKGLIRISADGTVFNNWTTKDGFPTNTLHRIESVDDKFLWISTISGLCRFDMTSGKVLNFNHLDGLPANEFLERVSAKTGDGRIVFGSIAGFTIVDPAKVIKDTSRTEIILSDITFQNKSIRSPKGTQLLSLPLEETKEITLPFDKNSFSVYFFLKGKSFLKKNNYSYRLVGLEDNWINLWGTNHTTYTNLSPGTYTFEIKSAKEDNYPTRLIIHIQSPWYLTWYAYVGYFSLAFTVIGLMLYAYLNRMQLKKEKEISEYKIHKEQELTEKKLSFFTNISHDLKTPLTLIDAPVNDLLQSENMDQQQMNKLMVIRRNSRRLYNLITDLLDFRKITEKQYGLEVKELRISKMIEDVCLAFKEECKNKSIDFEWFVVDDLTGFVDGKKIEKILWNLLSNAVKFTPDERSIFLSAEEKIINGKKNLRLVVKDEGIGISENDKEKIFNRFFQAGNSKAIAKKGTGIGLSIVKELVEIHHGEIAVESKLNIGTTFTIIIPSGKESYSREELTLFENPSRQMEISESMGSELHVPQVPKQQYNLPKMLVVEDHSELREYLLEHFRKNYTVYEADNGLDGLSSAKEINPDIILTDVQMPTMNGYEFCKEIRLHFETSHIPIVMLTANSATEQQIEGLNTGADAYLTKPFDIKLLDTVVNSTLENRRKLRLKFLGIAPTDNLEKTLPKKEIDFIFELKKFIEENISNQNLNVELLSEHFAVSRTPLYQKIKALTGSTPNNLIKSIRLKKAYELLSKQGGRVSEVAYLTGFSDPNYFATCFKKEFGENPSQIGID